MRSRSPKLITSFPVPIMCLCKFGQNPPNGSEDTDMKLRGRRRRRDPQQKRYAPLLSVGGIMKGQCLELGLVYKPCLETGRCLNCVWDKVYRLEIYVLTPAPVSLISIPHGGAPTPGCSTGMASKTHIKLYMFSFQTILFSAINYISPPIYKSLCLPHCKNCVDKICVDIK